MSVFAEAIDDLFADPNLARDAIWRAGGTGAPVTVRIVLRQPDRVESFGETRIWSESIIGDVRTRDAPSLAEADAFEIDGANYVVQGEPVRDSERLVWSVELRPV
ncbi:MAG: hypothetical protein AB1781_09740 [Pseudomonadota bacterium]